MENTNRTLLQDGRVPLFTSKIKRCNFHHSREHHRAFTIPHNSQHVNVPPRNQHDGELYKIIAVSGVKTWQLPRPHQRTDDRVTVWNDKNGGESLSATGLGERVGGVPWSMSKETYIVGDRPCSIGGNVGRVCYNFDVQARGKEKRRRIEKGYSEEKLNNK